MKWKVLGKTALYRNDGMLTTAEWSPCANPYLALNPNSMKVLVGHIRDIRGMFGLEHPNRRPFCQDL